MKITKFALLAAALGGAPVMAQDAPAPAQAPAPAPALANPQVVAGATVYGPQGGVVGTIERVADAIATVDTGQHKAPLPVTAFGQGENGPTITVTQAQLNQLVEQQLAQLSAQRDAALVPGATVLTADNQQLGTIDLVEGDSIVVVRGDATSRVNLPRNYFTVDGGTLKARLTLQEIETAAAQAASGANVGQ